MDHLDLDQRLYAVAGAAILFGVVYHFVLEPTFLSPLSKIPAAHPLANITPLWIQWQRFKRREFESITEAFESKGPYVRLGPKELAMNTLEGIKSVYGVGNNNFDKHPSYEVFITHGHRNVFTALGEDHGIPRRRVSPIYSRVFVQTNPHVKAIMHNILFERILPTFDNVAKSASGNTDIFPVLQSYTLDFTNAFVFGLSRGTNFVMDPVARDDWLETYILSYPSDQMFWLLEHPGLTKALSCLGFPVTPKGHLDARKKLEAWTVGKMRQAELALNGHEKGSDAFPRGEFPILYNAVKSGVAKSSGLPLSFVPDSEQELELASECFDHILAARDTFGTSFTYVIYQISRHPEVQETLREELRALEQPFVFHGENSSKNNLPVPAVLSQLPMLNAVINEGLRLRNNMPDSEPRLTPAKKRSSIGPLKNLPPGIRVGAYGWCLHRDGEMFPSPNTWNPSRWLNGGGDENKWLFAFGGGSRGCVGQQLAMELMRFAVAGIYTNFKTSVADESEYPGDCGFVGGDCREKLFIQFDKIDA